MSWGVGYAVSIFRKIGSAIYWISGLWLIHSMIMRLLLWISDLVRIIFHCIFRLPFRRRIFYPLGGDEGEPNDNQGEALLNKDGRANTSVKLPKDAIRTLTVLGGDGIDSVTGDSTRGSELPEAYDGAEVDSDDVFGLVTDQEDDLMVDDLSQSVVTPSRYDIKLSCIPPDSGFEGEVMISLVVNSPTDLIKLSARDLCICEISLVSTVRREYIGSVDFRLDPVDEKLVIDLPKKIPKKSSWVLTIKYSGKYQGTCSVIECGNFFCAHMTNFENICCRGVFPCFDRPDLKSIFALTLEIPLRMTAISNMEVSSEECVLNKTTKNVVFQDSPPMSAHQLAFTVGDYSYAERYIDVRKLDGDMITKAVRCRVYFLGEEIEHAHLALECGCKVLKFLEDYTLIPCPIPKIDQVFLPVPISPVTTSWGLIIHSTAAIMREKVEHYEDVGNIIAKRVGYTLAAQWFGNLVTMRSWGELWFSEAISSFIGLLALKNAYPSWDSSMAFISGEMSPALDKDSLITTEPLEFPKGAAVSFSRLFSEMRRIKGVSILRMVYLYVGDLVFMEAVRSYLGKYKYQYVIMRDLWFELKDKSGTDIDMFVECWLEKPGYPIVRVTDESYSEEKGQLTISLQQTRYCMLSTYSEKDDTRESVWWIPLHLEIYRNGQKSRINYLFSQKEANFTFTFPPEKDAFWRVNAGFGGFYRTWTSEDYFSTIFPSISKESEFLGSADKIQLLSDAFSLARSGKGKFSTLLSLITSLHNEKDVYVLREIENILLRMVRALRYDACASKSMYKFIASILESDTSNTEQREDDYDVPYKLLKKRLAILTLPLDDIRHILEPLISKFDQFIGGDHKSLPPQIRHLAFTCSLKCPQNVGTNFNTLLDLYKSSRCEDIKNDILYALGAVSDIGLMENIVNNIIINNDFVNPEDSIILMRSLTYITPHPGHVSSFLGKFLKDNWNELTKRYKFSSDLLYEIFYLCLCTKKTYENICSVKDWARGDDIRKDDDFSEFYKSRLMGLRRIGRKVTQALELMEIEANWTEKYSREIDITFIS